MVEDTMFSGESKNIEYKVSLPDKSEKYMKTIVAFANTQGGKLIVGVDDKTHQIVGVENDVLFQMMDGIANAVSDSCVPQIIPDIEPQTVDGKTVIVVSVEAGKNRPYKLFILSGKLDLKNNILPSDRKSTRLNSSHIEESRMPSSA